MIPVKLESPIEIVDLGSSDYDPSEVPPYKPLMAAGLAKITGFEPQRGYAPEESSVERHLPYVIYDGLEHSFFECYAPGMSGLYGLHPQVSVLFPEFESLGKVTGIRNVQTKRLGDVEEIDRIDFLKADIQGAELGVFRYGQKKLASCMVIHTEVAFAQLYVRQPLFGAVDQELRSQGFRFLNFAHVKHWPVGGHRRGSAGQLIEADAVFIRDLSKVGNYTGEEIRRTIEIIQRCYGWMDVANFLNDELQRRER